MQEMVEKLTMFSLEFVLCFVAIQNSVLAIYRPWHSISKCNTYIL